MEDKKILELLWNRISSAIDALAAKYGQRLYLTAMNILGNHHDAEETVNDTYLALWNAIPPQRPDPLAGYVHRTGRNIALNRLRSDSAQKRNSSYDLSLDELADVIPGDTLEDALDARELGRAIDCFLDTLSQQNRVFFLRRYWFGDSVMDLANAHAMTPNAMTVRLSRLRAQLKDYLIKEGIFDETQKAGRSYE